jgi:hypothetical protein
MDELDDYANWKPNFPVRRKKKEPSLLNVSRSILQEYLDSPQNGVFYSNNKFIPFSKERDGLNRLIKSNSQKFSSGPKKYKKTIFPVKKFVSCKKVLLKSPMACETPAVGTYSVNIEWKKQTFNRKSPKRMSFKRGNLSPIEINRSVEKNDNVKGGTSFEKIGKKREMFVMENRNSLVPRQKGVWEGIEIKELPKGLGVKLLDDCTSVFANYESNIMNSMKKFKIDMNSIQKYLK